ncbi:hypothetical protein AB0H71_33770 [Nocardia sp. NPDC050697]|uniref:hypothetical protein n=1 Tax=Nocardia sp. NPDC050697 TaxID=3155158 RepID=UPI0033FF7B1C
MPLVGVTMVVTLRDVGIEVELVVVVAVLVGTEVVVTVVVVTVVAWGTEVEVTEGGTCTLNVASTEKLAEAEKPALTDGSGALAGGGSGGEAVVVRVSVESAGS